VPDSCIFCKIIAGQLPAHKIFEDEKTIAILDLYPGCDGHTLVIPKDHHTDIFDTPTQTLTNIMSTVEKIAERQKERLGCHGVNIVNNSGKEAGQVIFHLHFHVIPRFEGDGINLKINRSRAQDGSLGLLQQKLKF